MRKTAKFRLPALPVFSRLLRDLSKEERFFGRDEDVGESKTGAGRVDLAGGCGCCRRCRTQSDQAGGRGTGQDAGVRRREPRAADLVKQSWPDEAYASIAVAVMHRPGGLTDADRQFALRLSRRFERADRPNEVVRVLGPASIPEIAGRMVSRDGTVSLVAVSLATAFVAPATQDVVVWIDSQASSAGLAIPGGLELRWTGDAVIGRDYMANVQTSLDRAAVATVVLLLIVLLAVYRSFWLALVPLVTIGVSLVISRGVLAWMILAGWEVSSLVELFLIAILFGTGTDFCLFLSWRYAEHLNREQSRRIDARDPGALAVRPWSRAPARSSSASCSWGRPASSCFPARGRALPWAWFWRWRPH